MFETNEQNLVLKYSLISEISQFSWWGILFWLTFYISKYSDFHQHVCTTRRTAAQYVGTRLTYFSSVNRVENGNDGILAAVSCDGAVSLCRQFGRWFWQSGVEWCWQESDVDQITASPARPTTAQNHQPGSQTQGDGASTSAIN